MRGQLGKKIRLEIEIRNRDIYLDEKPPGFESAYSDIGSYPELTNERDKIRSIRLCVRGFFVRTHDVVLFFPLVVSLHHQLRGRNGRY